MNSFILRLGQLLIERGAWYFAPISWIWALVVFLKNKAYDFKVFRPLKVSCPVISIGNIVAGGAGKTPFVQMLARHFSHRKVAILTRMEDEGMLLKRDANVYVGKDRRISALKAVQEGANLILLDDGFQHRKLHRDMDIVLLSGKEGHYLPRGFLRDSPRRLNEADAVFRKGEDFYYTAVNIPPIQGSKVGLFAGIANPDSFKKIVLDLGIEVVAVWILADHEAAPQKKLDAFASHCKALGAKALVTTEKDFIKGPKTLLPIHPIEIAIKWKSKENWLKLIEKIDQKIDNNA